VIDPYREPQLVGGVTVEYIFERFEHGGTLERWRVKTTDTHHIEVVPMLVNWRIHTVPIDGGPLAWSDRYWCYEGRGAASFVAAVLAADLWDGRQDTEPVGWKKSWDLRYDGAVKARVSPG
jgi:hypothetical protein